MLIVIALITAILLQFFAAIIAISLIKRTKYNISWIILSFALCLMAVRRVFELVQVLTITDEPQIVTTSNWIGICISIMIAIGIIFIKKIFGYLERIESFRLKSESKILSTIIKTEEKERRRFAKDLHDGLGPLLSSVKMSVSALSRSGDKKTNKNIIDNMEIVINEALSSIKEISNNLSPHILDNFGLLSAVKSFAEKVSVSKTIIIDINSNLNNQRFDYNVEVILYRVICELISNTLKHASAKTINIDLYLKEKVLSLYYYDDGVGFNVDKVLYGEIKGMGLSNILSRIKSINGTFDVLSDENEGVHINIKVNV